MKQSFPIAVAAAVLIGIGSLPLAPLPAAAEQGCPPGWIRQGNKCIRPPAHKPPPGPQQRLPQGQHPPHKPPPPVVVLKPKPPRPPYPPPYPPLHADEHHRWHPGDRVHRYQYVVIHDYRRYRLPPPPYGTIYILLGGQVLQVDADTLAVLGMLGLMSTLLNSR